MKRIIIYAFSLFALWGCKKEDEKSTTNNSAPEITILKPTGNYNDTEEIPVEIQFSDDNGLLTTTIEVIHEGSVTSWHTSQRDLTGETETINYLISMPTTQDVRGNNTIKVICTDQGGLKASGEESFIIDAISNQAPAITLIEPVDSFPHTGKIPVNLQFSDNLGLSAVEVTLGNQSGGNTVWHNSQRGLSGLNDQLQFEVDPPANIDVIGENYILIKCTDTDGNEAVLDEPFFIYYNDTQAPIIQSFDYDGIFLTNDSMDFKMEVIASDNVIISEIDIIINEVDGQDNPINIIASSTFVIGQPSINGIYSLTIARLSSGTRFNVKLNVHDGSQVSTAYTFSSKIP